VTKYLAQFTNFAGVDHIVDLLVEYSNMLKLKNNNPRIEEKLFRKLTTD
jgi:hypothetical protein